MHKDVVDMYQTCDVCQRLELMWWSGEGPLKLILAFEPFMKCCFDFMNPIKPTTRYNGNWYILMATNYTRKWVETKALWNNKIKSMTISF
jgi:hypothetical protein